LVKENIGEKSNRLVKKNPRSAGFLVSSEIECASFAASRCTENRAQQDQHTDATQNVLNATRHNPRANRYSTNVTEMIRDAPPHARSNQCMKKRLLRTRHLTSSRQQKEKKKNKHKTKQKKTIEIFVACKLLKERERKK
jgi:hypothetical protein